MDDTQEILRRYHQHQIEEEKEMLLENAELITSFKQMFSEKGITFNDNNFNYVDAIGVVASYPNIVEHLCTGFSKDKEGLIEFKLLNELYENRLPAKGFLYAPNFMLMANPYFRRGFHPNANFAPRFIDLFWKYRNPDVSTLISLDYDRVRINVDNIMYFEEDTWYGAQFNKEIKTITDGIVKLRPPLDIDSNLLDLFFDDTYSLHIKWKTERDRGKKIFEAEEFKTEKITVMMDGKEYHPSRYVHSEFDLGSGCFEHFDGAIHFYTKEEYELIRDSDSNYNSKNNFQIKGGTLKLFKMTGIININTWIEFTSHFFSGNPLIFEYFEGKYPDNIADMIVALRNYNNK